MENFLQYNGKSVKQNIKLHMHEEHNSLLLNWDFFLRLKPCMFLKATVNSGKLLLCEWCELKKIKWYLKSKLTDRQWHNFMVIGSAH